MLGENYTGKWHKDEFSVLRGLIILSKRFDVYGCEKYHVGFSSDMEKPTKITKEMRQVL